MRAGRTFDEGRAGDFPSPSLLPFLTAPPGKQRGGGQGWGRDFLIMVTDELGHWRSGDTSWRGDRSLRGVGFPPMPACLPAAAVVAIVMIPVAMASADVGCTLEPVELRDLLSAQSGDGSSSPPA